MHGSIWVRRCACGENVRVRLCKVSTRICKHMYPSGRVCFLCAHTCTDATHAQRLEQEEKLVEIREYTQSAFASICSQSSAWNLKEKEHECKLSHHTTLVSVHIYIYTNVHVTSS